MMANSFLQFSTPLLSLGYLNPYTVARAVAQTGDAELNPWVESVETFLDGTRLEQDFGDRFRRLLKGEDHWRRAPIKNIRTGLANLFPTMRHPEGWWQVVRIAQWLSFAPSLPKVEDAPRGYKKTSMPGVVELDLTQPIDVSLLLPPKFGEEYDSDLHGKRETLSLLISVLQARGVERYKLDFRKLPHYAGLENWREFLSRISPDLITFDRLMIFFEAYHGGTVSLELLSKAILLPQGRMLCERAITNGYLFENALQFCLSQGDPIKRGRLIERKIRQFQKGPMESASLLNLDEGEKFALYVLLKKFLKKQKKGVPPHILFKTPSYTLFSDYLALISHFPWLGDFSTLFDKHSPLNGLMTTQYYATPWYFLEDWEKERLFFSPLDSLCFLNRLRLRFDLPESLLKRAFEAMVKADKRNVQTFYYALGLANAPQKVEAAVVLLESELEVTDAVDVIFDSSNPLEEALNFQRAFPVFVGDLTLRIPYKELSNGEKAALYVVCYKLHQRIQRKDEGYGYSHVFPPFSTFNLYLKIELQSVQLQGGFSIYGLFQTISGRFTPDHVVEKYLDKRDTASAFDLFLALSAGASYLSPESKQRVHAAFQKAGRKEIGAFFQNILAEFSQEEFDAALELLEAHIPLMGQLFQSYVKDPQRLRKRRDIQIRSAVLERGGELKSIEDPFEILAAYELVKETGLTLDKMIRIVQLAWTNYVPPSPSIHSAKIQFTVPLLNWRFGEKVDRRLLGELIENLRVISDKDNVELIIREIVTKMDAEGKWLLDEIGKTKISDLAQMVALTIEFEPGPRNLGARRKISQIEQKYLYYLHLIHLWHSADRASELEDIQKNILRYHWRASEQDAMDALRGLNGFYEMLYEKVGGLKGSKAMPSQILKIRKWVLESLKKVEKVDSGESVEITLQPCRTVMDIFLGYVTDNCLARPDYAQYFLADDGFMPYRILVDGKWRGSIMTYTRVIEGGKKILILTGIDPQRDLRIDPSVFVTKLGRGFCKLARGKEHRNYDKVLVPKLPGTQSSRQGLIPPEIEKRYGTSPISFYGNVFGFPRRGPDYSEQPFYAEHQEFLFLFTTHTSPDNPTHPPRKKIP